MKENMLHMVTFGLVIVGGLNWLLFAIVGKDISAWLPGEMGMEGSLARVIYLLVGLSAIYLVSTHKRDCKGCHVNKM